MIEIRRKQLLFVELLPQLILYGKKLGFGVVMGQTYRTPEECERRVQAGNGINPSLHGMCLAVDLYLFKDKGRGAYLEDTEYYAKLGHFWESLDPLCSWGGDFDDGNHFSIAHGGMR